MKKITLSLALVLFGLGASNVSAVPWTLNIEKTAKDKKQEKKRRKQRAKARRKEEKARRKEEKARRKEEEIRREKREAQRKKEGDVSRWKAILKEAAKKNQESTSKKRPGYHLNQPVGDGRIVKK